MAWETRTGKTYYYRGRRTEDGRVVKEYVGCGPLGELAAQRDRKERRAHARQCTSLAELQMRLGNLDRLMKSLDDGCRLAMQAVLLAHNYFQHRSEWRPKHVRSQEAAAG